MPLKVRSVRLGWGGGTAAQCVASCCACTRIPLAIYAHCTEISHAEHVFMLNGFIPATFSYASCAMFSPTDMSPSPGEPKAKSSLLAAIWIPRPTNPVVGPSRCSRRRCQKWPEMLDNAGYSAAAVVPWTSATTAASRRDTWDTPMC